jgi:hypothetical protein
MIVTTPNFSRWQEDAYTEFFRDAEAEILAAAPSVKDAIGAALINELHIGRVRLDDLMLWPRISVINGELVAGVRLLDHSLAEITAKVKSYVQFSTVPAMVEAAKRVQAMRKRYGNVAEKKYEAQVGDIKSYLDNLNGPYAADVTLLGIAGLQAGLQSEYDSFKALLDEREALYNARPKAPDGKPDNFRKIRKYIEPVFRKIMTDLNSGSALGLSQAFDALIAKLNPKIEQLNFEYRNIRHSLTDAQIAPIADQPYTGIPATPPLTVYFVLPDGTIILLILGKDYNVTYDKNIDVGQARCTIRGKGKYKDSQTVTFVIKRGPLNAAANAAAEEAFKLELEAKAEAAKAAKAAKAGAVAEGEGI